ncbi:MAG: hypothetical protein U0169_01065 [Polyangiaceae bacterium]
MHTRFRASIALAVAGAVLGSAHVARAAACSTVPGTKLVIESGDTQEPLLKSLGKALRDSTDTPITILYKTTGTCTLAQDMYTGVKIAVGASLFYLPSKAEDPNWTTASAAPTCTVDTAGGQPIDLAIGATFLSSCTQNPPPAGVALFTGPIQGYAFIVPKASTQKSLTAEQGYFVWGFGKNGQAEPWTDEAFLFGRTATKSTALTLAAAIGVPVTKLKGQLMDKSSEVLNLVANSTNPEKTIGLMGTEIYDANRDKANVLAFKGFKQRYAYYPDSTSTARDKKNLRDGHYLPWSPTVYITAVDGAGVPTNVGAKLWLDLVLGNRALSDVDGLAIAVQRGLIPQCAMTVTRAFDGADLASYAPPEPCGCFYEATVPDGKTSCKACTNDGECGSGKCRHKYCEAK